MNVYQIVMATMKGRIEWVYFVNWMYAHQSHHNRCSNTIVYVSNTIVYVSNTIVYVVNLSNW